MTTAVDGTVRWSDLVRHSGMTDQGWTVAGVFQSGSSAVSATFRTRESVVRFGDFLIASPADFGTARLYRRASIYPPKPEYDLSNLRFDTRHGVAAVAVLADDREEDQVYRWTTRGDAGRDDVVLSYDSWNEHQTTFPPESFVTTAQLREIVSEWAFGEEIPPPVGTWGKAPDNLGWF